MIAAKQLTFLKNKINKYIDTCFSETNVYPAKDIGKKGYNYIGHFNWLISNLDSADLFDRLTLQLPKCLRFILIAHICAHGQIEHLSLLARKGLNL